VNVYFIVSSLARIGQQELMFRYDPKVKENVAQAKAVDRAGEKKPDKKPIDVKEVKPGPKTAGPSRRPGPRGRGRDEAAKASADGQADRRPAARQEEARSGDGSQATTTNGSKSPETTGPSGGAKSGDGSRADWTKAPRRKPHQRSQSKRTRKSR
jgi:hypothetical protein